MDPTTITPTLCNLYPRMGRLAIAITLAGLWGRRLRFLGQEPHRRRIAYSTSDAGPSSRKAGSGAK